MFVTFLVLRQNQSSKNENSEDPDEMPQNEAFHLESAIITFDNIKFGPS